MNLGITELPLISNLNLKFELLVKILLESSTIDRKLFVVLNMGFHPYIIRKMTNSRHKNLKNETFTAGHKFINGNIFRFVVKNIFQKFSNY